MDSTKALSNGCILLALLALLTPSRTSAYGFSGGNMRRHSQLECEGYEIHLRCPGKDIISVQGAAYGRQDDMTCAVDSDEMQDMHCRLPNAKDIVAERCNGNTSCDFEVGSSVFPDPCPGTKKYLNVMYECVPFIISCPGKLQSVSLPTKKLTKQKENAAWMKDPFQVSDRLYYMGYTKFSTRQLFEYEYVSDMNGGTPKAFYPLPDNVDGTGFVVYDRSLFFTPEGTNQVKRYDLSSQRVEATLDLPAANHGGTSPYAIGLATDIDLAVDENGLWAIYATEYNDGNIVISRLKHHSLEIVKTWKTSYDKLTALNSFVVCGTLYVVNYDTLKIDYMFNTSTNIGTTINIRVPGLKRNTSAINYNPKEQRLYIWDRQMAITYDLNFQRAITTTTPRSTTTTPTTTTRATTTSTTTTKSSAILPPILRPNPKCPATEVGGLSWPSMPYGTVAKVPCPGYSQGNAFWVCGGNVTNPKWDGEEPDFSQCVSEWIRDIETELLDDRSVAAELSQKFTDTLRDKVNLGRRFNSWDIEKCVKLLKDLLNKATSERQNAAVLTGSVLKTASLLLDLSLEDSWNTLTFTMQNQIASELIRVVEDTAFFLAYDISTAASGTSKAPAQNKLNWSEKMVSLGIRVDPVPENPSEIFPYEKIIWVTGQGDSVRLDTNAVLDAIGTYNVESPDDNNSTTTRHLAIVLLSFRNLGQYLKDEQLYKTHLQPVNSRVLSISAASITRTTVLAEEDGDSSKRKEVSVIVNRHQNLDLARPLRMTIAHKRSDLAYHACAFWKYNDKTKSGRWWRKGCYAVEVNSTHSVCECEHMTSFAVLSSNVPFPEMGYEGNSGIHVTTISAPIIQRDLPILRAGLGISLFFLLLVAITLFPLSAAKRLQSDIHTIHKNLIVCLIATEVVFLCGIDRTVVPDVCGAVAGLLHFGLLATFTWASLEAFHLMVVLGDITERRDRWRWYYAVGYGLPTLVVAVSAAADHTGYGTGAVCWLKTDGSFIWSFIGPCCFVIICCIVFLSITMYRLHLYTVSFSDGPKHKSTRSGVARSCALMFLLCALWSCGVLWLSNFQPRATAILFCILSAFYGIASFFLHCILPEEIRSHYSACFSRVAKRSRHSDDLARHRHMSNNSARHSSATSHGGSMRHDLTASYGGYYTTRTGVTTTLLPVSAAQSAALAIDQVRCASDMDITRMTQLDNSRYHNQRGHSEGSSAFDLANDQPHPRDPLAHHTHPGHGCNDAQWSNHRYEQPLPQIPNCSTIASGASGHYNHLHEHCSSGSHHHLAPPSRCQHHRFNHHYETMDHPLCKECPAELGVQVQMGENGEPQAVHYRHCYDDTQHRTVAFTAPVRRSRASGSFPCCDPSCTTMNGLEHDHRRSGSNPSNFDPKMAVNRGYLTHSAHPSYPNGTRRGHIQMGTSALAKTQDFSAPQRRQKPVNYYPNRAGRSSDPLSTDQGYDTDSQQQGCRGCCDSHSDNDHSCSPRPPSLPKPTLVVRSVDNAVLPTITAGEPILEGQHDHRIVAPIPIKRTRNTKDSNPELSDCGSENDREVERIISSNHDESTSSASPGHGDSGNFEDDDVTSPRGKNHHQTTYDDMIDTACGGRLSVAESVTSWCAHAGSNPRAVNSSYGKNNKGKTKKTADPNVILQNAKMRSENGDAQPQGRSKTYVYTLPGTAASGTKAKIDLKSGGISMITNL